MNIFLISKGKSPVSARKLAIFILALLIIPIFLASGASDVWLAVLLVSLAAFIHQGYTINIFAIVSDIYPKKAVGSVTGLAGFSGAVGGLLFSCAAGLILEYTGSYYFLFGLASIAYLLCWLFLKLLIADDKTVKI